MLIRAIVLAAAALLLTACGGGGGDGPQAGPASGKVGVLLTDAPTAAFAAINMTITRIELLAEERPRVTLFEGEETVDLLKLTDFAHLFSLAEVPAGRYEKLRLTLRTPDGLELVEQLPDGALASHHPKLPGNGKLDLNPRGAFDIVGGQTLYLQVDVDAEKSIHAVRTGNGKYRFRPVVFVDVLNAAFSGKLVRIAGQVRALDGAAGRFSLCPQAIGAAAFAEADLRHCVRVLAGQASLFDTNGDPAPFAALAESELLTAIGFIRAADDSDDNDKDKDSDKDADADARPEHGRLYAEVIELGAPGSFETLDGRVASEPAHALDRFTLGVAGDADPSVQLQQGSKVFSRRGARLDYSAIAAGLPASVDGSYSDAEPGLLKAALVILALPADAAVERLSGAVLDLDVDDKVLTLATAQGDRLVRVVTETLIFAVNGAGSELSELVALGEALEGQAADVYCESANGEFVAKVILFEAP